MKEILVEVLRCPVCRGGLEWSVESRCGDRILEADAVCDGCGNASGVTDGIGVFLPAPMDGEDLWQQSETGLQRYFRENPGAERELLCCPPEDLGATDLFLRSMVLEMRGDGLGAAEAREMAAPKMYTEGYLACLESQMDFVLRRVEGAGSVVDLASGRGALVERLVLAGVGHVVATDLSPLVLRRSRAELRRRGLAETVSFLALDARATPFADGGVETMTSNLGLANVTEPRSLLEELRRAVSGRLLAISHFYPPESGPNLDAIRDAGMESMLLRARFEQQMRRAGWELLVANACACRAEPTPPSRVVEGARLDALPVEPTMLEWATAIAM
jgi:uncharacterized protein YbaR (Trm112 family)